MAGLIISERVFTQILAAYGLPGAVNVQPPQKGYRNISCGVQLADGRHVNFILYKGEAGIIQRIQSANSVGLFLHNRGFPVRYPVHEATLRLQAGKICRYGALYNYLPGATIPWESYTKAHIKLLGKTMSDMHATLASAPLPPSNVTDECLALNKRMVRYFARSDVTQALAQKLQLRMPIKIFETYDKILQTCRYLPNPQALHMDFVRGNILFASDPELRISGIIDFEKAAAGHPVFDIARTLAFLLVDCKYKPEAKVRKYFLHSGYAKRGAALLPRIRVNDKNLLEALTTFFLLHDLYKFLRHNPYEALPANEHFTRTRQQLLKQSVIG